MEFLRQMQARWTSPGAASRALLCLVLLSAAPGISLGNIEVDALHALRQALDDPAQVLESWDPSSSNPCAWFHVTCNTENSVLRIDLGDAELSGSLVPELGQLSQLQYLEIFDNNITGAIPAELGNLTKLVSLDLYDNDLTGAIPGELGNTNLTYLRLNNNSLSGEIPEELTNLYNLKVLDLSYNFLIGPIPVTGAFAFFGPGSFAGNPDLFYPARPPAEAPAPALSSRRSTLQQIGLSSPQLISTAVPLIELIVALSCALLAWG